MNKTSLQLFAAFLSILSGSLFILGFLIHENTKNASKAMVLIPNAASKEKNPPPPPDSLFKELEEQKKIDEKNRLIKLDEFATRVNQRIEEERKKEEEAKPYKLTFLQYQSGHDIRIFNLLEKSTNKEYLLVITTHGSSLLQIK